MKKLKTTLLDGTVVIGDQFDADDYAKLVFIFKSWMSLNSILQSLGGRSLNVPDVLSEGLYCYLFNAVRTNGTALS